MKLRQFSVSVDTTGGDGAATGSGTIAIPMVGYVEWVHINYHATAPNTTDVTVAYGATLPGGNVLAKANSATDALFFPRATCVDSAAAAITDSHEKFAVAGDLTVTVGGCNALTGAVVVTVAVSG